MTDLAQQRSVDVPVDPVAADAKRGGASDSAPFWRSIRWRLAAWYALVMFLVILGISVAMHALLERTLEQDARQRLQATSSEITHGTTVTVYNYAGPRQGNQERLVFDIKPPDESSLILSGLWFQYYTMYKLPYESDTAGREAFTAALEESLAGRDVFREDGQSIMRTITVDGEEMLVYITPLSIEVRGQTVDLDAPPGWLVVGEPLGARNKLTSLADQSLLMFGLAGVLLAAWGGWLIAGRALEPVEKITESANAIAVGAGGMNFSRRVDVPETGDELSRLASTFNAMLDRIEAAFRTQQRFVADASHELRSPLTAVRGNVDVLLRQLGSGRPVPPEDIIDDLKIVQRESNRMGRLIEDLLTLARTDVANLGELLKPHMVRLDQLAHEAHQISRQLAQGQDIRVRADTPIELLADKDRLVQVMIILMENAIRHTPEDGVVSLTVDRAIDMESQLPCARISVADTGTGIAAEHIPHLFERFYRVERARSRNLGGTGLGLSIALAVVRAHSGWIDVDSEPGAGTTFTVWLPFANGFAESDPPSNIPRSRLALRLSRHGRPKVPPRVDPRSVAGHAPARIGHEIAAGQPAEPSTPDSGADGTR